MRLKLQNYIKLSELENVLYNYLDNSEFWHGLISDVSLSKDGITFSQLCPMSTKSIISKVIIKEMVYNGWRASSNDLFDEESLNQLLVIFFAYIYALMLILKIIYAFADDQHCLNFKTCSRKIGTKLNLSENSY